MRTCGPTASRTHAGEVAAGFASTNLELHRREPAPHIATHFVDQLRVRVGQPAAAAVDGHRSRLAAEQAPDRYAERARMRVPHRDIGKAQCPSLQAFLAEVLRFMIPVADECKRRCGIAPAGEGRDVAAGAANGLRRVVESQQVRLADDTVDEFEFADDELDGGYGMGRIGDRT